MQSVLSEMDSGMKLRLRAIYSRMFFLVIGFFLSPMELTLSKLACAAEITLAWDANSENNLAGYKLYYESETDTEEYKCTDATEGVSPIIIPQSELVDPNSPTYTLTGLKSGRLYYLTLTAFDSSGMESVFSDEVDVLTDSTESSEIGGCFISNALDTSTIHRW